MASPSNDNPAATTPAPDPASASASASATAGTAAAKPAPPSEEADPTFRHYTPQDGLVYAQHRQDYHATLYGLVLEHHAATGGQFGTLLDVGCGPGIAARALAPRFEAAWGLDPSEGMIGAAREIGGDTGGTAGAARPIRFEVADAEELAVVPAGSVDLIVSAAAAHWFDMPRFWRAAGRVLKPGGTVALWVGGAIRPDADFLPDQVVAGEIQAAVDEFDAEVDAFLMPGNRLCVGLYRDLGMPWDDGRHPRTDSSAGAGAGAGEGEGGQDAGEVFDKETFRRVEWGTQTPGSLPMAEFLANGGREVPLDALEMVLGTASYVTRWREANAHLAGTGADVVKKFRAKVQAALERAGLPADRIRGGMLGVLLLVKKKATLE